ncbi:MAG: hypothetical protein V7K47_26970 [Nostoc sp.]
MWEDGEQMEVWEVWEDGEQMQVWEEKEVWEDGEQILPPSLPSLPTLPTLPTLPIIPISPLFTAGEVANQREIYLSDRIQFLQL